MYIVGKCTECGAKMRHKQKKGMVIYPQICKKCWRKGLKANEQYRKRILAEENAKAERMKQSEAL